MKIIDLLNKIAKGEDVPKQIYYKKQWWEYNPSNDYEGTDYGGCFLNNVLICDLNDEVIIEEDKKIEKLDKETSIWEEQARDLDYILENKISELIDEVNKLKGDNDDR